tara:strand:+ start:3310 stop:3561 length:252 start_codon:yes stop_codon:yes gene_type:complete
MQRSYGRYIVPIWLSNWTFKDQKNKIYKLENHIVKGYNKGSIFTDKVIVDKAVNKLIGRRSKKKLVPVNLTLISQHGYGVEEN